MSHPKPVSCVMPTYNEAPRIAEVLRVAATHPLVGEVIVVDDGSDDSTADIAEEIAARYPKVSVLRQPENAGKSRAVARGIDAAQLEFLMLLDSDLHGLTQDDLTALIEPVVGGRAGASISLRGNAPLGRRLIGLDFISGERVMARALLSDKTDQLRALPRFGLEVLLNRLWLERGFAIAVARWPNVADPMKAEKRGRGRLPEFTMTRDIWRVVPLHKILPQILALRARRV